ncbi:MAG: hypothetical protein ACO1NW_00895 [Chitinophagaceae bacterium]
MRPIYVFLRVFIVERANLLFSRKDAKERGRKALIGFGQFQRIFLFVSRKGAEAQSVVCVLVVLVRGAYFLFLAMPQRGALFFVRRLILRRIFYSPSYLTVHFLYSILSNKKKEYSHLK